MKRTRKRAAAFAAGAGRLVPMTKPGRRPRRRRGVFEEAAEPGTRSPLFWWMMRHHDRLAASLTGRRPSWEGLAAEFAALGLTDQRGQPASPAVARQTWLRARKAAAAAAREREREAAERRARASVPPARRKPGSVPAYVLPDPTPPVPVPAARPAALVPSASPAAPPADGEDEFTPEERERIRVQTEKIMGQLRKSDEKFRLG